MERSEILALAELARLRLTEAELAQVGEQITRLVQQFAAIAGVPTDGIEPSPYPLPLELRPRPDEAGPVLPTADVLGQAPEQRADAFVVPRVVDG